MSNIPLDLGIVSLSYTLVSHTQHIHTLSLSLSDMLVPPHIYLITNLHCPEAITSKVALLHIHTIPHILTSSHM